MIPAGITMWPFLCHPTPPQTHTDTCLLWQIACDVPLQTRHGRIHSLSLGLTAAESSSGQDAPASAPGSGCGVAAQRIILCHPAGRQRPRSCLEEDSGCKQQVYCIKWIQNYLKGLMEPELEQLKFTHRWKRRSNVNMQIFSLSYWADIYNLSAAKNLGSDCCLEASDKTQS